MKEEKQRILRNSIILYIRMFVTMIVSLYTSRIVLNALGFVDYGIYNVVGGIVFLFTFLNGSMASTTQRYLNYALGKEDLDYLRKAFSSSLIIHFILALIILILSETIGLWFFYNEIQIPPERVTAAFWVYQFSISACVISIISIPFVAEIIAHERMQAFAYIAIFDSVAKLFIAFLITKVGFDRLIFYAFLILLINIIDRIIYNIYCHKKFKETCGRPLVCKAFLRDMGKFAGWSMWSGIAYVSITQGLNFVLNIYFGPVINAARGIAVKVQNVAQSFVQNFQVAVNPQITKSYAKGDIPQMKNLILSSSRLSFFLMLVIAIPLFSETDFILGLWLKGVPPHTSNYLRIILLICLSETLTNALNVGNQATGNVKFFQTATGIGTLIVLPLSIILLEAGMPSESVFYAELIISIAIQFIRISILGKQIDMSFKEYFQKVFLKITPAALLSAGIAWIFHKNLSPSPLHCFYSIMLSFVSTILVIFLIGLSKKERSLATQKLKKLLPTKK